MNNLQNLLQSFPNRNLVGIAPKGAAWNKPNNPYLIGGNPNWPLKPPVPAQPAPRINTWDWQGGEASPYEISTPSLGSAWHYDENGRIVPNNPKPEGWIKNWGLPDFNELRQGGSMYNSLLNALYRRGNV